MSGFIAPREWYFVADMNYSGSVTVTDAGLWVQWLFFYPGDFVITMMTSFFPQASDLLGINQGYGGLISFVLSCFLWWVALKVVYNNILPLWNKEFYI